MVKVHLELEGEVADLIWTLRRVSGGAPDVARSPTGLQTAGAERRPAESPTIPEPEIATGSADFPTGRWTEDLAGDFMAGLDPVARRMTHHIWGAGAAGIHRSALCRRMELTPAELHSLLIQMGHALRRFQRERGIALPRPIAANSPLQSYFVDPEFAAGAASRMFGEGSP